MIELTANYCDSDVPAVFPGFKTPDRPAGEPSYTLNQTACCVDVMNNGCDGIVALMLGRGGCTSIAFTMGSDGARALAKMLIRQADAEDAKLENNEEEDA